MGIAAASPFTVSPRELEDLVARGDVEVREVNVAADVSLDKRAACSSGYSCVGGTCTKIVCQSAGAAGTSCVTYKAGKC